MIGGIGPTELIIILGIALVIFGPKKLSGVGSALGQTIRDFKKSLSGADSEIKGIEEEVQKTVSSEDDKGV
jgi:sec-independent protein translocase protein TatA